MQMFYTTGADDSIANKNKKFKNIDKGQTEEK